MLLDVSVLTPREILFKGQARSVIVPGEQGVFEVLPYHKRILSRLISGVMFIDEKDIRLRRGVIKADLNKVTVIVEEQ